MTWLEFKTRVEQLGVKDADVIEFIDTDGYAGQHSRCDCECSVGDAEVAYRESINFHDRLVAGRLRNGGVAIYPAEEDVPYNVCPDLAPIWTGPLPSRAELPFPVRNVGKNYVRPLK